MLNILYLLNVNNQEKEFELIRNLYNITANEMIKVQQTMIDILIQSGL